ncbi:MAG: amidase [Myxococcaceae bacterium]|nr:amidase [Myxococcaceae bacterium]
MAYKRDPVTAPRLRGMPLRLFVETLEGPLGRSVLRKILNDSGFGRFQKTSADGAPPVQLKLPHPPNAPASEPDRLKLAEQVAGEGPWPTQETVAAFARAYRKGELTPVDVARRVQEGMAKLKDLNLFVASDPEDVRRQAEASARRFAEGRPLSVFDGVPVAVKDELDQVPYPTTVGTSFVGKAPATQDATLVARLRAAGAVLIGKANMHEIGINPIGINPHYGATRNPWNPSRITGGSSSGSAAAVASGLCPVSIGADGGGSIRIPAALCGVVGLKATWGRISEHGVYPLCWHVGHVGPIGRTVRDVAAAYAVIAGADPLDPGSQAQPFVELDAMARADLSGIRLGIHRPYFEDADPDVVRACDEAVRALVAKGATVVDVPAPDLNTILWQHAVIILTEMVTCMMPAIDEDIRRFGLDVRTNLAIGRYFSSSDYVHALQHRHKLTRELLATMQNVDAIVTPTTATTAPEMPEQALPEGESNLVMTDGLMRFIRPANITGFPGIAVPAGYDRQGLPVSLHFMGRPWEEGLLLRLAAAVEEAVPPRTPARQVRLLG